MTCPQLDEIILFLDGELSVNRSDELRPHLEQCSVCSRCCEELQRTIGRFAPGPDDVDSALVQDIVTRARSGKLLRPPRRKWRRAAAQKQMQVTQPRFARRWLRWTLPAVGLAAAATLLAVLTGPALLRHADPSDDPAFSARGGPGADARRWLALWIYQKSPAGRGYEELREGATIRADARLVFGFLNQEGTHRYLMIFGVSDRRQVLWYYPAYHSKDSDPTSIPIGRGRHELREEIQHDLPAGRLRITALFSKEPLHVSTIERLLRSQGELGLKETAGIRRTVMVSGPAAH